MSIMATALAAAVLGGVGPAAQPSPLDTKCEAELSALWPQVTEAFTASRWDEVLTTARTPSSCADWRVAAMISFMRASVFLRRDQPAEAIRELDAAPATSEFPFWRDRQLVLLAALSQTGATARFVEERDRLVAANELAITGGADSFMQKVDEFETPFAKVTVFELPEAEGKRQPTFIAQPRAAVMPIVVDAVLGPWVPNVFPGPSAIMENCQGTTPLNLSAADLENYPAFRSRMVALFSDPATFVSGNLLPGRVRAPEDSVCPNLSLMAPYPGLSD
jgi:hypothetical protein